MLVDFLLHCNLFTVEVLRFHCNGQNSVIGKVLRFLSLRCRINLRELHLPQPRVMYMVVCTCSAHSVTVLLVVCYCVAVLRSLL